MSPRKKAVSRRRPNTTSKGRLLEQVTAWLHAAPGVAVETNVRVPCLRGGRKREIDVQLSLSAAGYPIRLAIECKNKGKVGSPDIDAFIGKLQDIGIPPHLGIFISAGGYTSGAVRRAGDAQLRVLVLRGLTADGLAAEMMEALESILFLAPSMGELTIENDCPGLAQPGQLTVFWNEHGQICGSIPDLLWRKWYLEETPGTLGKHNVELSLPEGWIQVIDGKRITTHRIAVNLHVVGLLMSLPAGAHSFALVSPENSVIHKLAVRFSYDQPPVGQVPLQRFSSEEEFRQRLLGNAKVRVLHRVRVPRLMVGPLYWPPTAEAIEEVNELYRQRAHGNQPTLAEVEGSDLATAFGRYRSTPSTSRDDDS